MAGWTSETGVLQALRKQLWYRRNLQLTPLTRLREDLGLDSLEMVELTLRLEYRFRIEIADPEVAEMRTVADAVACVQHHLAVNAVLANR